MIKILLVFLTFIAISACDDSGLNTAGFAAGDIKWAKVDRLKIERHILAEIKARNLYPELPVKNDALSMQRAQQSEKVNKAKSAAINACLRSKTKAPKADGREEQLPSGYSPVIAKAYRSAGMDVACLHAASSDATVIDLRKKLESMNAKLKAVSKARRDQDNRRLFKARKIAEQLISSYAVNRFHLIIDAQSKEIYNPAGISVDVTSAVMKTIDIDNMDLTL